MAHKIGNNPHCIDCKWYVPYETEKNGYTGECQEEGTEPMKVKWQWDCSHWVDKITGLTHFEVLTRVPENYRTPADILYLSQFIEWRKK